MFVSKHQLMNKVFFLLAIAFTSITGFGQTTSTEKSKSSKKEIRKEVSLEDNNGAKTLTITTKEGRKTKKEVYTGAEADAKLKELESQMTAEQKSVTVDVNEVNGQKTVIIKRTENGKTTEEMYTGIEAEEKLKELNLDPNSKKMKMEEERIEIKKETHQE